MHCNLRPLGVAPVVLGFNYVTRNATTFSQPPLDKVTPISCQVRYLGDWWTLPVLLAIFSLRMRRYGYFRDSTFRQFVPAAWTRSAYPFLTSNVSERYMTPWAWPIDPLTLNVCHVPDVMWSNSIPNFSETEHSAAHL